MFSNLKATILGNYVKLVSIDVKTSEEHYKGYENKNDDKLKNNLIRAKNKIIDIGLANDFSYYFTCTFNTSYDRYNLEHVYRAFKKKVKKMRDSCGHRIDYLIVPEQHKDGAWHFHGFLTLDINEFLFTNNHGHLDIKHLCDLGWVNVQVIKDKVHISHYITKYISKNLGRDIALCNHCYYASTGLKKGVEDLNVIYNNERFNSSYFDFKSDYCYKKIITLEEYKKIKCFLKDLC